MEEKNMEEIQTIRDVGIERVDGINERKWEENQEFLRIEEETIGRERKNLEDDLQKMRNQNQADLKNLKNKNLMVEMKINETEKILEETARRQLDDEMNKIGRNQDFQKELIREKRELEMAQIREETEVNLKHFEIQEKISKDLIEKEEDICEQILQHRQNRNDEDLKLQKNILKLSILDFQSEKIEAVNEPINELISFSNEMNEHFLECSEILDGIERLKNTPKKEEPTSSCLETPLDSDREDFDGKSEISSSSTCKKSESRKKPKKSTLKLLDTRLRSLRGDQLGKLISKIPEIERKSSRIEEQKELFENLKPLKSEIGNAQKLIPHFCSFTGNKEFDWEAEKVEALKKSMGDINVFVIKLIPLRNDKEEKKRALVSPEQTSISN
ncbi:hypothetical protein L3Y34_019714 [Caenorhabditis briggsae]|uniref:Uncharacterized protein n=1 Tax=Caenorhabditis briggsae TaxID=6238 RepID=A0AAE9DPQ7_CAEBR|nr:hypothetical protein L3Y34_019714 [Caenorhabditis briggsae]